jgi:glucokinase
MGTALISIVNVLDPDLLILGGGVAEGGPDFIDVVRKTVMEKSLASATEGLRIVPAGLGNAAGFIGAAFLSEEK